MRAESIMEEAIKTLGRIQERTQLSYAWFAASFLHKLLKNMFSGIYIDKNELEMVKLVLNLHILYNILTFIIRSEMQYKVVKGLCMCQSQRLY